MHTPTQHALLAMLLNGGSSVPSQQSFSSGPAGPSSLLSPHPGYPTAGNSLLGAGGPPRSNDPRGLATPPKLGEPTMAEIRAARKQIKERMGADARDTATPTGNSLWSEVLLAFDRRLKETHSIDAAMEAAEKVRRRPQSIRAPEDERT